VPVMELVERGRLTQAAATDRNMVVCRSVPTHPVAAPDATQAPAAGGVRGGGCLGGGGGRGGGGGGGFWGVLVWGGCAGERALPDAVARMVRSSGHPEGTMQ